MLIVRRPLCYQEYKACLQVTRAHATRLHMELAEEGAKLAMEQKLAHKLINNVFPVVCVPSICLVSCVCACVCVCVCVCVA